MPLVWSYVSAFLFTCWGSKQSSWLNKLLWAWVMWSSHRSILYLWPRLCQYPSWIMHHLSLTTTKTYGSCIVVMLHAHEFIGTKNHHFLSESNAWRNNCWSQQLVCCSEISTQLPCCDSLVGIPFTNPQSTGIFLQLAYLYSSWFHAFLASCGTKSQERKRWSRIWLNRYQLPGLW